ncbi:RNA-directed DNA polymerase, eukaryota [Tanacetum coccineum]
MITTTSRIEDKKPSNFILPLMGILGIVPCAKDVDYITRDLAVSSVRLMNNDSLRSEWRSRSMDLEKFYFLSSKGVVLEISRRVKGGYGTVVDVFILNRKSKSGKRFAFVRFIKVVNVDRLVDNLCTLWIGCMHLHANVSRFDRPPIRFARPNIASRPAANGAPSFVSVLKGNPNIINHISTSSAIDYKILFS